MQTNLGVSLLRANAVYLLVASVGGFLTDVLGAFFAVGPVGRVTGSAPYSAIGFVEAHGLAFILGVLLWKAKSMLLASHRCWSPCAAGHS